MRQNLHLPIHFRILEFNRMTPCIMESRTETVSKLGSSLLLGLLPHSCCLGYTSGYSLCDMRVVT